MSELVHIIFGHQRHRRPLGGWPSASALVIEDVRMHVDLGHRGSSRIALQ